MAFTIHFHLGNGSALPKPSPERRPAWWRHRYGSRSEYEAHLRRTFSEPATVRDAQDDADEPTQDDDAIILDPDDLGAEYEEPAN